TKRLRSVTPKYEVPQAKTSVEARADSTVHPPEEAPEIAMRAGSARPAATSPSTAATVSSTSTIPHCPRRRLRQARPKPVEPPQLTSRTPIPWEVKKLVRAELSGVAWPVGPPRIETT